MKNREVLIAESQARIKKAEMRIQELEFLPEENCERKLYRNREIIRANQALIDWLNSHPTQ